MGTINAKAAKMSKSDEAIEKNCHRQTIETKATSKVSQMQTNLSQTSMIDEEIVQSGFLKNNSKLDDKSTPQLKHLNTIAGEYPKSIFKQDTIIMDTATPQTVISATSGSSFCFGDDISENIRKKIMAYSLSEADSDCFEGFNDDQDINLNQSDTCHDDFNIRTLLADTTGTSTETESTIVSAATKIQAGCRGFLTRKRIRLISGETDASHQESQVSFGNKAISESLERLIENDAAKRIQSAFRNYWSKKNPNFKDKTINFQKTLAKRRLTFQRGEAFRTDSIPDEDDKSSILKKKKNLYYKLNWVAMRQNSMPVQIDSEVFRVIPKKIRKRVKSAEVGFK